jgi:hypothetical protein
LSDHPVSAGPPCIVDNVVLAMFVDAGRAALLSELAAGQVFVPPSILDPQETPPFAQQPVAEFGRGALYLQQRLRMPFEALRFHRRTAFYLDAGTVWQPVVLSVDELRQTDDLVNPATWARATASDDSVRIKKIDRGESPWRSRGIGRYGPMTRQSMLSSPRFTSTIRSSGSATCSCVALKRA